MSEPREKYENSFRCEILKVELENIQNMISKDIKECSYDMGAELMQELKAVRNACKSALSYLDNND